MVAACVVCCGRCGGFSLAWQWAARLEGGRVALGLPPVSSGVLSHLRDKIPEGQMIPCYGKAVPGNNAHLGFLV